ncbi:MAG: hypothetical protein AAFR38_05760 [Planctomycetota bacterium]
MALSPAIAIMLRDLGLEENIVGKHDYDLILGEQIPAVGHQSAIDYEALLRTEPTHVLIQWGRRELPGRLTELAAANGWAVTDYPLLTLDDVVSAYDDMAVDLRDLGPRSPMTKRGFIPEIDPSAIDLDLPSAAFAEALRPSDSDLGSIGPVLLLAGVEPPGVLGPGSAHHDILLRLGARPAVVEGNPWIELDVEDIYRLGPSAIVLIDSDAPEGATAGERLGAIAGLPIPAVEDGRMALITDPLALTPSTALLDVAEELRAILEAWAGE